MSSLIDHITLPYVLTLIAGLILGASLGYLADWIQRKRGKPATRQSAVVPVAALVITLTMMWIMVSTGQARECAITLNRSLQVEIVAGKMEREAFQNAVVAQQSLPKDIQDLPENDPAKKAATKPLRDTYFAQIAAAKKLRDDNAGRQAAAQRACGST